MKKLMSILLSIMMTFASFTAVYADTVAKVDSSQHQDLKSAITAADNAGSSGVITLLSDVTLNEALDITLDHNSVTLDLDGHTLTGRVNLKKGNLTVRNGLIVGGDKQPLNVYGSSEANAENYSVLTIASNVTVTGNNFGVCLFGNTATTNGYGAVVNIEGTITTSTNSNEGAIFVSGNLGKNIDSSMNNIININSGANITSQDAALALNGNATVNVFDGAQLTGNTAITVKRGVLNIQGGTIVSNGTKVVDPSKNMNGSEMTGAGISITDTYIENGPLQVNISGGNISSTQGYSIFKKVESNNEGKVSIDITGGSFSDLECLKYIKKDLASPATVSLNCNVTNARGISVPSNTNVVVDFDGFTYSVEKPGAGSSGTKTQGFQLLEDSKIVFKNGTIECTSENKGATWNSNSEIKGIAMLIQNYADLTLDNMTIDGTNIAHNGTNVRYMLSVNSGNVVLQNGTHIIAPNGDFAFDSCKYGSYKKPSVVAWNTTIDGKVEATGGDITLCKGTVLNASQLRVGENKEDTSVKGSVVTVSNGATVNGIIAVFGKNTLDVLGEVNGYIATNGKAYNKDSSVIIEEGANIIATGDGVDVPVYIPNGTLRVTGGTITGETAVYFKSTDLNITGGNFIANGAKKDYEYDGNGCNATGDALVIDSCKYPNGIDSVSVTGGYFESTNNKPIASFTKDNTCIDVIDFVSGGSFNKKIDDNLVSLGYECKTADGKLYTVSEKKNVEVQKNVEGKTNATIATSVEGDVSINKVEGLAGATDVQSLINSIRSQSGKESAKVDVQINLVANLSNDDNEKTKILSKIDQSKGQDILTLIEIKFNQTVKVNDEVDSSLSKEIKVTDKYQYIPVVLPQSVSSNKVLIIRNHEGRTDVLQKAASRYDAEHYDGDCFYIDEGTVVIKSKNFSVYAVVTQTADVPAYKYVAPEQPAPTPKPKKKTKTVFVTPKTGVE